MFYTNADKLFLFITSVVFAMVCMLEAATVANFIINLVGVPYSLYTYLAYIGLVAYGWIQLQALQRIQIYGGFFAITYFTCMRPNTTVVNDVTYRLYVTIFVSVQSLTILALCWLRHAFGRLGVCVPSRLNEQFYQHRLQTIHCYCIKAAVYSRLSYTFSRIRGLMVFMATVKGKAGMHDPYKRMQNIYADHVQNFRKISFVAQEK